MMTKKKYALMTIAAGVVLVIASALLMIFTGPRETPWELTKTLLPGDVLTAYIWYEKNNCSIKKLTEEDIAEAVRLVSRLGKSDFNENSDTHTGAPAFGLHLVCRGMDIRLNPLGGTATELLFDANTAESLKTDRWVVNDAALSAYILNISGVTG
jgi:hypothetical protein